MAAPHRSRSRFHLRSSRLAAPLALACLCLSLSMPALADPTGAEKAQAESLFREGRRLMEDKNFAEACPKFAESQRLDPGIGTLINLALCHEEESKTASAWGEFMEAATLAQRAGDKRAQFARDHAQKLENKLSRIKITGTPVEGMALTLDGRPLGVAALGAPLPVDPGDHVVIAQAPGKKRWEGRVNVPVGPANVTVAIPPLADAAPDPPPIVAPPIVTAPPIVPAPPYVAPPAPAPDAPANGARIAGAVATGVGGLGLVLGAVFGGLAFAKESDAREVCPSTACPTQAGLDLHESARRYATISTATFIAGGVAAAGGIVLLVVSRNSEKPGQSAWIAPQLGGLAAGGRF